MLKFVHPFLPPSPPPTLSLKCFEKLLYNILFMNPIVNRPTYIWNLFVIKGLLFICINILYLKSSKIVARLKSYSKWCLGNTKISICPSNILMTRNMVGHFFASTCKHKRAMLATYATSIALCNCSFWSINFVIVMPSCNNFHACMNP